jgi:hypothetical protein
MDSDMGDDYIIGPSSGTGTGGTSYEIQVTDASGNLVNNGEVYPLSGWTAGFTFAGTAESISSSWNAAVTQSGMQVTAINESYNAAISRGGSTTFGMTVNGLGSTLAGLTCTPT